MKIDKSQVKRILVITLSNVGDIILTTPVIRALEKAFPGCRIDCLVGPHGKEVFENDPSVSKLILYDKHMPITEKRRLALKLKKLKYDLVVDLKNTVFGLLIGPRFRTATIQRFPPHLLHARKRHLWRLRSIGIDDIDEKSYIYIPKADEEYITNLIKKEGMAGSIVVITAGAKSHLKRWTQSSFAEVADRLIDECKASVVFVGLSEDREIVESILKKMKRRPFDLVNRTNLRQLASLLKRSSLLITNDSAPLHLACAVGAKVLALFGPTDPKKYGPTGEYDCVINKKLFCSPCEEAVCVQDYECMSLITAEEVYDAARMMLKGYE